MLIRKAVNITIKDNQATLNEDFYLYKNDRNVDILFEISNFSFDFIKNKPKTENTIEKTNASYSSLRIIKPNGQRIVVDRCAIKDNQIIFTVTPEFIDELEEIGKYKLQITLYDEFEGRITIPPIEFEVLEPLFDDEELWEDEGIVGEDNASQSVVSDGEEWINDLNGREEIAPGTNLYKWECGDWISDYRLNSIHDNILRLNDNMGDIDIYNVNYGKNGIDTVGKALDVLLTPELIIESFNISINKLFELGVKVNWCDFSWSYNKDNILSQNINGIEIESSLRSYRYSTPFNTNKTFKLTANDGKQEKSTTLTVEFCSKIFWGATKIPNEYNEAFLTSLNDELKSTKQKTFTVQPKENQYIFYASPSRLGECRFFVGGFEGGFVKVATINHTNSYGYSESYYIYKSDNPNLGNTTVVVQ